MKLIDFIFSKSYPEYKPLGDLINKKILAIEFDLNLCKLLENTFKKLNCEYFISHDLNHAGKYISKSGSIDFVFLNIEKLESLDLRVNRDNFFTYIKSSLKKNTPRVCGIGNTEYFIKLGNLHMLDDNLLKPFTEKDIQEILRRNLL